MISSLKKCLFSNFIVKKAKNLDNHLNIDFVGDSNDKHKKMFENIKKYNKVKMHYESYIDENKQKRFIFHNNMFILGIIHDDENISDKRELKLIDK